jgi:hypothetical protein
MQEFSSISVSSYEAGSLAGRLTEQSRDGWSVVAIVPTGNTVTAYLCREATGADATTEPVVTEPAAEEAAPAEPASQPIGAGGVAAPTAAEPAAPEPAAAASATIDTGSAGAATVQTAAAPAGWYADPSGRFELRYWDGGQWTEHVSRAGQQYTDPPVA